ncbi:hypothetical protein M432DRAFT_175725 [Thermoascus aurantiacus ATCC 26904]
MMMAEQKRFATNNWMFLFLAISVCWFWFAPDPVLAVPWIPSSLCKLPNFATMDMDRGSWRLFSASVVSPGCISRSSIQGRIPLVVNPAPHILAKNQEKIFAKLSSTVNGWQGCESLIIIDVREVLRTSYPKGKARRTR